MGWRSTGYPPGAAPDLACSRSGAFARIASLRQRKPFRAVIRRQRFRQCALQKLVSCLAELTNFCTSRGIDGNCPRLPRLIHPCGGTPSAILHNPPADPPGHGHGRCGRLLVQSQYPEKMPEREKKEPMRQRWRVHTCALIILLTCLCRSLTEMLIGNEALTFPVPRRKHWRSRWNF